MARGGVNKAVVKIARNALLARGLHPSIDAVRVELGNTGSKTTIQRYLKELADTEAPEPEMPLDQELVHYIGSLVERLKQAAQSTLADDRAAFERQQTDALHLQEIDKARYEQLQRTHTALLDAQQEAVAREHALVGQLQACEVERNRLQVAHEQQTRLLGERAAQLISLEEKCRFTQQALEHYREHQVRQREQEMQRYDQQIQQLQHEARKCQQSLFSKQEEMSQLYRELERKNGEQLRHHQELHRVELALKSAHERVQVVDSERQTAVSKVQEISMAFIRLQERARAQLLKQRHMQRELRAQLQQVSQLQGLVARLTQPFPEVQ